MDHFVYRDGILFAEDVSLEAIAAAVGTPAYIYSTATLERHFRVFRDAFAPLKPLICYAVKANSNQAVLATLARLGAGADVVSGGELMRAVKAGIPSDKIVFSGVGKTTDEMRQALSTGIKQFNVESEAELDLLDAVAGDMGLTAPVSVRVNPDVDAKTHAKISTGKAENKFGVAWSAVDRIYGKIAALDHVEAVGIDVHIGSQLTELEPFKQAFAKVVDLVHHLRAAGHAIQHIDLGGGLGIPYGDGKATPPAPAHYGAMVQEALGDLDCDLIFEPGRLIAGNAGILLTKVLFIKDGEARRFAILDAAMNDLMRPAMYDAYHGFTPVIEPQTTATETYDFVGPVCESSDTFATQRTSPPLGAGQLLAIRSAGAYSAVMSSTYNTRPLVPEVMVNGDQFAVVRERQTLEALIGADTIPDWLNSKSED